MKTSKSQPRSGDNSSSMAAKLHDTSGSEVLSLIRDPNVTNEVKLERLQALKYAVKHNHIPEPSISPIFHITTLCLTPQHSVLSSVGFSLLLNVVKRLQLQEPHFIIPQTPRLLPLVIERLGDAKERNRELARQILTDIWRVCPQEVEVAVRDNALTGKSVYMKQTSMIWVSKTHSDHHLNFKAFVPRLMDALEDADGMVRDTAKLTVVDLFRNAPDHAKADLKKQLIARQVRKTIANYILSQLETSIDPGPQRSLDRSTSSQGASARAEAHSQTKVPLESAQSFTSSVDEGHVSHKPADNATSQTIHTQKELESIVRDMQPFFEGKESEQNWLNREKSIVKLGEISRGNAPYDFTSTYLSSIKTMLDGILKTVDSLRTTVSTKGCQLIQEIAHVAGPGLDPMVEILLQRLVKLCGGTKKISAANGDTTVNAILGNVSYNVRLLQHIMSACQDKNIQPRRYATGWVRTMLDKHGSHKSHLDHTGGTELLQKCIVRGLEDSDKDVRESMRQTYWKFALIWPDRADAIMTSLSPTYQKLLTNHPSNPDPPKDVLAPAGTSQRLPFSRSATALSSKPSLKEVMAAQKAAITKQRQLPSRPGSALSTFSPEKVPAPAVSGGLNSKPVRPMKAPRRPEVPRPATADPYSVRRKPNEMPATPGISSSRNRSKLPSPVSSPSKSQAKLKKFAAPAMPRLATHVGHTRQSTSSPSKADEDLTLVIPSARPTSKGSIASTMTTSTLSESREDSLRVYEDPVPVSDRIVSPVAPSRTNGQILQELTPSDPGHPNLPVAGRLHSSSEPRKPAEQSSTTPEMFLKTLNSGTPRIATGTLDLYGFRRIQTVLKSHQEFGSGDTSFEALLTAVLIFLESPMRSGQTTATPEDTKKTLDLRSQSLITLRDLQVHYSTKFAPHAGPTLCTLLRARRHYPSGHHIAALFSNVTNGIMKLCRPEPAISAILLQLTFSPAADSSTYMSITSLQTLLVLSYKDNVHLDNSLIDRLGSFVVKTIQNPDPDVRRAATGAATALHKHAGDDLWVMMKDAPEQARNLIAWSVAKNGSPSPR